MVTTRKGLFRRLRSIPSLSLRANKQRPFGGGWFCPTSAQEMRFSLPLLTLKPPAWTWRTKVLAMGSGKEATSHQAVWNSPCSATGPSCILSVGVILANLGVPDPRLWAGPAAVQTQVSSVAPLIPFVLSSPCTNPTIKLSPLPEVVLLSFRSTHIVHVRQEGVWSTPEAFWAARGWLASAGLGFMGQAHRQFGFFLLLLTPQSVIFPAPISPWFPTTSHW